MQLLAQSADPLTLLLAHPQLILVLFAGVAWLLKRATTVSGGAKRGGSPEGDSVAGESAEDERTRRVREEVRRRIAERRAGRQPFQPEPANRGLPPAPPLIAPRPAASGPFDQSEGRGLISTLEKALQAGSQEAKDEWAAEQAAVRAARIEAEERATQAAEARAAALKAEADSVSALVEARASAAPKPTGLLTETPPAGPVWLTSFLQDPIQARRAFVLREVLGPPVSLRSGSFY